MTDLVTAREELMAVAIGQLGELLDRMDTLAPKLDASQLALMLASTELAEQVIAYETRMAGITENAKLKAVQYIALRADEMARGTMDAQTRAMEEAARTVFRNEVGPAVQRVTLPLQDVAALARKGAHPWEGWLLHAATAVLSSAISWAMAAWMWLR